MSIAGGRQAQVTSRARVCVCAGASAAVATSPVSTGHGGVGDVISMCSASSTCRGHAAQRRAGARLAQAGTSGCTLSNRPTDNA